MSDYISDAEIRLINAKHRLDDQSRCVVCGEDDPRCLELHHIAGRANCDDVVTLCRNHHRKLSDAQLDHMESFDPANPPLHTIGRALEGLADLFAHLAEQMRLWAKVLLDMAHIPVSNEEGAGQ